MSDLFPERPTEAPVLLPVQQDPLTEDDAFLRFEESLDQRPDAEDLVVVQADPPPLGRGWAYDFEKRRFVNSASAHGPLETHGIATLRVWIEKALRTARGAYPIYSDAYGFELPADMLGGPAALFPGDLLRERTTDALLHHPRIVGVSDFSYQTDPSVEFVAVSFTVETGTGDSLRFENVAVG